MPLSNLVLEMGLRGVRVDSERLQELRKTFEKERASLVREYRVHVSGLFTICEQWKHVIKFQKLNPDFLTLRKAKSERNKLRKKYKSLLNPNSSTAQKELFYTVLRLPVKKNRKTQRLTVNEEAIQKLAKLKMVKGDPKLARLFEIILKLREVGKKISTYCLEET